MTIAKASTNEITGEKKQLNSKSLSWMISSLVKKNEDNNYQPTILGHLLLASLLSSVFFGSYALQINRAAARLNQWLNPQSSATTDVAIKRIENQMVNAQQELEQTNEPETKNTLERHLSEQERLKTQLDEIDRRLERYHRMMLFFYSRNYASISLTTISALIAGSCVLLISRSGWEQINNAVIHLFVFSSGCVILFSDISGIFQYDVNYQNVAAIYGEHMTLKNAIRSFLATGGFLQENPDTGETEYIQRQDTNRFIYYVDRQLTKFNQIPLAIDTSTLQRVVNSANLSSQFGEKVSFDVPEAASESGQ